MSEIHIHPLVDHGVKQGSASFTGGIVTCHCTDHPVKIQVSSQVAHNHACGCSKCWKPDGALFSVVGVVPSDKVTVMANAAKLAVVDPNALIQRHACKGCGVHLYGPVEKKNHPFSGLTFIHTELFDEQGAAAPGFAAFVSSIIESGVNPDRLPGIRLRLIELGLEPYDCLNHDLMDYISTFVAKAAGTLAA